ncbi:hypothetical protein PQX77_010043 [Marasmius sp. AFHP31]|nr:hypothetical protein PQX77_010043 [Marasmius sp. AFHP31]
MFSQQDLSVPVIHRQPHYRELHNPVQQNRSVYESVMFEPCEDDLHITRTPIEESYAEIADQAARKLDVYYFSQDPRPSLEELGKLLYAAWSKVWPNPLDVTQVGLVAGCDRSKAAQILEKQLIRDAVAASAVYRKNINEDCGLPDFTLPQETVETGGATWAEAVECGQWARWANRDYLKALKSLKRAEKARSQKHLDAWFMTSGSAGPRETLMKMGNAMSDADAAYNEVLQEFLGRKYC